MADAGRHERDAAVLERRIAQQLNDQLEAAIDEARVQVIRIDVVADGVRDFERAERAVAVDPTVAQGAE